MHLASGPGAVGVGPAALDPRMPHFLRQRDPIDRGLTGGECLSTMDNDQIDWAALDPDALRKRRADLIASLPSLQEVMHGSLIPRYTRCGKPNCHCATGQGHGPHWYLSSLGPKGRRRLDYIPGPWAETVRQRVENHHRLQAALAAVAEINRELVRRRQPG